MSYAVPYQQAEYTEPELHPQQPELIFVPRSKHQWWPFLLPAALCAFSWTLNGQPLLTDLGFLLFAALCAVFLTVEFIRFPRRFGIGGIILYGGVLIWFCHDYFANWFLRNINEFTTSNPPWVVAKAATLHVLFVIMLILGMNINRGQWAERLVNAIPDPGSEGFYFALMMGMFAIGISPFFLFSNETPWMGMYHAMTAAWTGSTAWNVWRTGNLNTNWGGYVAQILQIGGVGGIFAITYAIIGTRSWSIRLVAFCIWAFWALMAFQTDRRGEVAYVALPPLALLFIKFQSKAAQAFKRFSVRAYVICGLLGLAILVVVQYQGTFRGVGLAAGDVSEVSLFRNQGNSMFSEGLPGYYMIPDQRGFFRDNFPGASILRPIPDSIYWFVIGVIPRALWVDKPVDPLWEWYNSLITGNANGRIGTTISHGLVGNWFFNYGFPGIVEGGLLVGWLLGVCERSLRRSNGRLLGMLMSLGLATWLFRLYRDFTFIDLYPLIIGGVTLTGLIIMLRPFLRPPEYASQGFPVVQEQQQ